MQKGQYIIVTNPSCNLYCRRCKVLDVVTEGSETKYLVYSKGLEEEEILFASDFEVSKF